VRVNRDAAMTRRATLRSFAKINLDLRVLEKHEDGFHELRTVFQTISLADKIEIEYESARRTELVIEDALAIPDNLVIRAARMALEAMRVHAKIRFRLEKRIPMGGGLGGGSSNAASVLLALPVLAGRPLSVEAMAGLGSHLGSDIPFFLTGGTAVAIGRGTELYGLPDVVEEPILVVSPGLHVASGPAYQALGRGLTFDGSSSSISSFQAFVRALGELRSAEAAGAVSANDFETVVFSQFPQIQKIVNRLRRLGAVRVRMTGSGSAVFAIFRSVAEREHIRKELDGDRGFKGCLTMPAKLLNRRSYQSLWRAQLREHLAPEDLSWPPRSRHAR
jgi:4-diphosphocytidyl-2-C-methyl-D-erythritol kinase